MSLSLRPSARLGSTSPESRYFALLTPKLERSPPRMDPPVVRRRYSILMAQTGQRRAAFRSSAVLRVSMPREGEGMAKRHAD